MVKRILIVDDDRDLAGILARRCAGLGIMVSTAHDAPDALSMIAAAPPDLICLDVTLPSGDGIKICETLAADAALAKTPVIILTGRSDPDVVRRCHALCAYYVPKCTDVWPRIRPLLDELLGPLTNAAAHDSSSSLSYLLDAPHFAAPKADAIQNEAPSSPTAIEPQPDCAEAADKRHADAPPWVLHIDDDLEFSNALRIRLEQHGVAVVRAADGMEGYRSAFSYPADAILLDFSMPNGQGDYVLQRLKENPVTRDIPVIVLTGHPSRGLERRLVGLGAAKFLVKPLKFDELVEALAAYIDVLPTSSIASPAELV